MNSSIYFFRGNMFLDNAYVYIVVNMVHSTYTCNHIVPIADISMILYDATGLHDAT